MSDRIIRVAALQELAMPGSSVQEKLDRFDFEAALELLEGIDLETLPPVDLGRAVGMGARQAGLRRTFAALCPLLANCGH